MKTVYIRIRIHRMYFYPFTVTLLNTQHNGKDVLLHWQYTWAARYMLQRYSILNVKYDKPRHC